MTIKWTGFPAPAAVTASDVLVGLAAGAANARFLASSLLLKANNLSDVASKVTAFNNVSPTTTKGDIIWNDGTNNVRLAIGSLNQVLIVGASNTVTWAANPALLKASNLSDVASKVISFNNVSPTTTKGDIVWNDGTNNVRLPIGTLNQIMSVGALNTITWIANPSLLIASNLSDVADAKASFDNISPLTTKGDLIWFDGTNNSRVGIGTLNQILSVGASNTVTWIANPSLLIANDLSDLNDVPTALGNLGLSTTDDVEFKSLTVETSTSTTSSTSPSFISTGLDLVSTANAITAHAGGGQGSATQLTKAANRITIVATVGDSVKLPVGNVGTIIIVSNANATNAIDCFPTAGGAINAQANDTALSIAAGSTVMFVCMVNLKWNTIISA
jgi:hypothetical protein